MLHRCVAPSQQRRPHNRQASLFGQDFAYQVALVIAAFPPAITIKRHGHYKVCFQANVQPNRGDKLPQRQRHPPPTLIFQRQDSLPRHSVIGHSRQHQAQGRAVGMTAMEQLMPSRHKMPAAVAAAVARDLPTAFRTEQRLQMKRLALMLRPGISQQITRLAANGAAPHRPEHLLQRIDSMNNMNSTISPRHNDQTFL